MTGKPAATTRSSSRAKTTNPVPTTTRTTRARTATSKSAAPPVDAPAPALKRTVVRKPLVSKDNSVEAVAPPVKATKAKAAPVKKAAKFANGDTEPDREPIMAYLRIRPRLGDDERTSSPYLTPISDTSVNMTNPQDPQDNRSKYRFSAVPPSSIYTFSHVFLPSTTQHDFFTKTTLPLVKDVLMGQNGLLFTYGVTNSGKTYTVQGGTGQGTAGILPRSLDVIFNSVEGLHGDGRYRPVRLHGVELSDDQELKAPVPEPALADVIGSLDSVADTEFDIDPTVVPVDRNYEYTIWISYAEVYNEKVYDLLASVKDESQVQADSAPARAAGGKSLILTRQALTLRPSPPSDNVDSDSNGKYIAGLRQFRVTSAAQAKAIIKLGQLHRRVFGTLANRESSRSHGMVIIKVVRCHRGEKDDPTSFQISRLTLVDLAGSERTKHTHTTGDRLKEAGNINKSLMVLGQCMEVMRSNQRKIAISLSQEANKDGRVDTRDVKKALAIVPFRHSKLTESLMDYFIGDGRTVMIVNVNPYDTGYDENSHVMRFAALAKEVYVNPAPAPMQRVPVVGPGSLQGKKIKQLGPLTLKDPDIIPRPFTRKVTISMGGRETGRKPVEAVLEVLEEDEQPYAQEKDEEEDDDYPINPLVDALFDEVEHLRMQIFESEMRCALIEAETREEVMREMEERMRTMEAMYTRRLMSEMEQNELKTDAKIDMLHQSGLFGSPTKASRRSVIDESFSEEEEDVEMSLVQYDDPADSDDDRSLSLSPLAKKALPKQDTRSPRKSSVAQPIIEKRKFVPDPPMLPSDTEDAEMTEREGDEDDTSSVAPSGAAASELGEDDEDELDDEEDEDEYDEEYSEELEDEDEEEIWEPPSAKTPKAKTQPLRIPSPSPQPQTSKPAASSGSKTKSRVSKLAEDLDELNLIGQDPDDSVAIIPKKKGKAPAPTESNTVDDDDDEEFELPVVKKKKRIIGKKPLVTEEDINRSAWEVEKNVARSQASGNRRFGK
ncbi:kinesin-domain-containing protein [Pholiota conissans]|uniref:Kinesin-domain-containing protein n=1 Tax=Pholiota conissans TaxID=109636 RepID=A0A9P6CWD0_9AGAR|nr:kinesin-domain-containing protein [Pholiota conissans]